MFKNVKKVLFALVLSFVVALAFACGGDKGQEANKENCKEFCDSCPTCDTCNNASAETCKEFCPAAPACNEASAETCKKFQDFVAPTNFYVDGDTVLVGQTKAVYVDEDEWEPENCDKTLVFISANPEIATVDADGVVTGVRPGKVLIYVYSPLNKDLEVDPVEFEVKDAETSDQKVVNRELAKILSELPAFVAEDTPLPTPWNTSVKVTYKIGSTVVEKLEVPADLAADQKVVLSITVELGDAQAASSENVWLVKDARVNTFLVIDSAAALLENYFAKYVAGEKVAEDLALLDNVFGCSISWSSNLATALDATGKYNAPNEDKSVTLDALIKYGEGSRNISFVVTAKGYSAEEKADAIMASTFGKMEGKEFNTSIVLPEFDDLFGAKLSYTSQDTTVYDNTGKLVAPVTEAKEVKFTVKIEYTIAGNEADNFTAEKELTIKAIPANAASTFLEAALATDGYKKYQSVVHAPWGQTAGNIVFEALPGMVWDVENVKLDARLQDDYQIFSQAEAGAALKLEAQYLRYQLVSIKGTYTKDGASTDIVLFFNIGISETPLNIISAIWRSSAQKDTTLSPEQGKYDLAGNVSYFDKKIGYVTETYGSGYFSGWSVSAVDADGKTWQTFMMEVLTVYIREDANGVYIDPANVNGGIAGAGGNWGVWYVNTTDKEVNIEVGVYGDVTFKYAEGHETATAIGSRLNIAMDGYALGFVADKDGKIIHGSNNTKLQDGMSDKRAVLGGKTYKAGDKITEAMFNAMQLDGKETKFDAIYTAADNMVFVQNNEGTFKKVVEEEVVSYVAIKEGEEVAEADRFAPTYAKGATLTADQYNALGDADKKLVTVEYKANAVVEYVVPNLFGDSSNGAVVNYLTIPANGFAMSWKYQFYGVGNPATVYPFCQDGSTLKIEHFEVHPLSSMDAEYATNYVVAAEDLLKEAKFEHADFEANVNAARGRYDKLSGDTLADVFPAARLTALEAKAAEFLDADITALLASEPAEGEDKAEFATALATMWSRLYKTENDAVVNKLSDEITNALTKKADFDAKYAEYAAIDLHITYDYNGGYIQGFWKDTDKATFLSTLFLPDLYNFMVAKGAWADAVAPTLEEFCDTAYWTNYAKNEETVLTKYLFTPKVQGDTVNENYHDIIEGSDKFFNSPEGHKYIALMDYVDESTRSGNMGGQDAWGRKGEQYAAMEWLPRQSYYSTLSAAEQTKDLTTYGGNPVMVTNSGAVLGAYRFAQWVGGTGSASYKSWIPNNVWSNIFDRQYTQEHNTQIYHCTDLTVKLQDEPYKEGFKFLGWKFEDGKDAVITGSMFADVTVYAAWAPALEDKIEEALGVQLEGVFYGPTANPKYTGTTATGTIADQYNMVGLGDYAIITDGKLYVIPKYAGIELGADATADVTLDTKEAVQVYGTDGTAQFSCGLVMGDTAPTPTNSYGHGALYHNAGEFKVTITEVKNTYGRNLAGTGYGYDRFLFHFDAEKQLYVGTKISPADGTSVTLEPGDFLWCPMTADRYCSGLTNCDGTSGVVGVWNGIENPEAQIISTKAYLPVDSPEWYAVEFFNEDGTLNKGFYDVAGKEFTAPVVEKKYYKFLGWSENKEATAADTLPTAIEKSAKYYPVFEKLDIYDEITVDPATDGSVTATYATIAEAISKSMDNAVITILAGTYDEVLVIDRPVQLVGPNAAKKGYETRDPEALFTGSISVSAGVNGVVIKGMAFGGDDSKFVEEAYTGNSNKCKILFTAATEDFTFINNYVTAGRTVLELGVNTNTVISGNFFNWTAETATAYSYWRPIRMDGKSTDYTFQGNKVVQSVAGSGSTGFYDILYFGNVAGTTNIIGNDISFKCYNWAFNIAASAGTVNIKYNRIAGAAAGEGAGFAVEGGVSELNIIGNIFEEVAGTTYSAKTCPTVNVKYNQFKQAQYKPRLKTDATLVHENNYMAATSVTAVSGYKTVTLDGNFNDMDAFLAAAKDVESAVELKDQSVWSSTYYPTYMYLNTGNKSALYWGAIYLVKSSIYEGYYEVVGTKVSGGSFTGACDFTITASEGNADDYAVLTGIAVGEFVKFASDPATLAAEAFETPVAFTVYNFGAK